MRKLLPARLSKEEKVLAPCWNLGYWWKLDHLKFWTGCGWRVVATDGRALLGTSQL